MMASGEQCVMMIGTSEMQRWCAESLTVEQLRRPKRMASLVQARETSGWMMSAALGTRHPSCTADIRPSGKITVAMAKMLAWCAQVSSLLGCSFFFISTLFTYFHAYIYSLPMMPPMNILKVMLSLFDKSWTDLKQMIKIDIADPEISPFLLHEIFFFFKKPCSYISHNSTLPMSNITGSDRSDYTQLLLEPQKALCDLFNIYNGTLPRPANIVKCVK